jgi:hypothetical protein
MKFKFEREWISAMVELQGDTSDPSSFRPDECGGSDVPPACGVARGAGSGAPMQAASTAPVGGTPARRSTRSGYGGGGSMSC